MTCRITCARWQPLFLVVLAVPAVEQAWAVERLSARGHACRIDLEWSPESDETAGYAVFRAATPNGPMELLNETPHQPHVYSDFLGENDQTRFYRVVPWEERDRKSGERGPIVSARSRAMDQEELLTSVEEATFRYFWHYGHPVSGLARERNRNSDTCTIGGSGFGLMAIVVGAERGFVSRDQAAERILRIVTFLEDRATRYHGAWSHWLSGHTGETIPFASKNGVRADDGGDLVETSFLVQGLLTVRQYFDRDNPTESEVRRRCTRLWREVEWDWYLREPGGKQLYWHWSPKYGWLMNHRIGGHFNECLITYLLALASETHPIPADCYEEGWIGDPAKYASGESYYGYKQWVGWPKGGRLFFTHYSFLGFDPRPFRDRFCNYFENNRNISLIHRAYCIENPQGFAGYGPEMWGLTACDTPDGYRALDPRNRDNGTIAPTAALSAMPYTPRESIAALEHYYYDLGDRLWGEFGFHDAVNLDRDWFAPSYLAIDQGPIVCMIENYRTGLLWKCFMANPEIQPMLLRIGWTRCEPVSSTNAGP